MSVRNDHHERTIVAPAIIAGVGVHTGRRVRLAVRPAPSGTGIVFVRTDITDRDNRIPVSGEAVVDVQAVRRMSAGGQKAVGSVLGLRPDDACWASCAASCCSYCSRTWAMSSPRT